jgi:hypothetical protein
VNVVCSFGLALVTPCGDGGRTRSPTMLLFLRIAAIVGSIVGFKRRHGVGVNRVAVASLSSCEAAAGGQRAAKLDLRTWFKFALGAAGAAQPTSSTFSNTTTTPPQRAWPATRYGPLTVLGARAFDKGFWYGFGLVRSVRMMFGFGLASS